MIKYHILPIMPTFEAIVLPKSGDYKIESVFEVSAEERNKTILSWEREKDEVIYLQFPRGNYLRDGDYIQITDLSLILQIVPKLELVVTVTADNQENLIRAAYHLGNRHVPLEINFSYLRFHPDPVIEAMLDNMGVKTSTELVPFYPEMGAYHH